MAYEEEPPPPPPPQDTAVDLSLPVYVSQPYTSDLPKNDRVKQNAVVIDTNTIRFTGGVTGFEPVNPTNTDNLLAYLAESANGDWELGYLSGFSTDALGVTATRVVDTYHNGVGGYTTLGGDTRIQPNTPVVISLTQRSNAGVCVGGSPSVTKAKSAAFGDSASATASAALALGHRVVANRVGGVTIGSAGVGYLGVDVAGHQDQKFIVGAQTSDWTIAQTLLNDQRGLSTGYAGTGLVKLQATVCANYTRFDGEMLTMSPASDLALFDVRADLFVENGNVTQVLTQQITQTFAGANSVQHVVSLTPTGDLTVSALSQVGAARTIAFVTISDLSQSR